jgi:hypothetical protein
MPTLNSHQKAVVQDSLERLAVAEFRNAMIATHQPGYENRKPMDRAAYMEEVEHASPEVAAALKRRLVSGRDKAWDYDAVMKAWPEAEARLRRDGDTAELGDLMGEVKGSSVGQ